MEGAANIPSDLINQTLVSNCITLINAVNTNNGHLIPLSNDLSKCNECSRGVALNEWIKVIGDSYSVIVCNECVRLVVLGHCKQQPALKQEIQLRYQHASWKHNNRSSRFICVICLSTGNTVSVVNDKNNSRLCRTCFINIKQQHRLLYWYIKLICEQHLISDLCAHWVSVLMRF